VNRDLRRALERTLDALKEARPYVYTRMQESDDWRSETAQSVLSRVDPAVREAEAVLSKPVPDAVGGEPSPQAERRDATRLSNARQPMSPSQRSEELSERAWESTS
jgi:hypothetical protein